MYIPVVIVCTVLVYKCKILKVSELTNKMSMSRIESDICGPFSRGLKCYLSDIKSVALGDQLTTVLFFGTTNHKFVGK